MASRSDDKHHPDLLLIGALLLSLALHALVADVLPALPSEHNTAPDQITVALQPPAPPKPLPPPEPPKREPEKPKEVPKQSLPPLPKPRFIPQPQVEQPPPKSVHTDQPPLPPPVMAVAPSAAEPPPSLVAPTQAAEPPRHPAPTPEEVDAARENYGNLLSREFAKYKQYPRLAQMRGWQGTVKVELQIDANGSTTSTSIRESSGFEILDKQALEMVRKASPLPSPPEKLRGRGFTITVPVAFRLE